MKDTIKVEIILKKGAILLLACLLLFSGCGANNEKEIKPTPSTKQTIEQNNEIDVKKLSTKLEVTEANGLVTMKYSLRNGDTIPAKFTFPSAQIVEFTIKNEAGQVVYQSSKDLSYAQVITDITIPEGKAEIWEEQISFPDKSIPYGNYVVSANLVATMINDKEIKEPIATIQEPLTYHKISTIDENGSKIVASGLNGTYEIKGTYLSDNESVFYSVEDGHNSIIEETNLPVKLKTGSINLLDFSVNIPKDSLPNNGALTLVIYEKNSEDQITNIINIPLQHFD
jgi:Intracellular proteinase inhibitor